MLTVDAKSKQGCVHSGCQHKIRACSACLTLLPGLFVQLVPMKRAEQAQRGIIVILMMKDDSSHLQPCVLTEHVFHTRTCAVLPAQQGFFICLCPEKGRANPVGNHCHSDHGWRKHSSSALRGHQGRQCQWICQTGHASPAASQQVFVY